MKGGRLFVTIAKFINEVGFKVREGDVKKVNGTIFRHQEHSGEVARRNRYRVQLDANQCPRGRVWASQ